MPRVSRRAYALAIIVCLTDAATAEPVTVLTRDRVIAIARKQAPAVRAAATRTLEARGRLVGARVLLPENPVLEVMAGPRWSDSRSVDAELQLAVPIPLGGKRDKRVAVAAAGIERDVELSRDAERASVGLALAAYYRAVQAKARVEVSRARKTLADSLLQIANERRRAGDVSQLEVNLATNEVTRAESEILAVEGALARARADLATTLGLTTISGLDVDGELGDRAWFDLAAQATGSERSDVRAARAEVAGTGSEVALADAARFPDLSLRVAYKREDIGTDIVLGGLAISLPFFSRGQGERAESRARAARARVELETRQSAVAVEVEGARATYASAVSAVKTLEDKGLQLAIQNESMARESYRAGKIDLATLLVIQREALETRREHLEGQLEAALAGVELRVALGVL